MVLAGGEGGKRLPVNTLLRRKTKSHLSARGVTPVFLLSGHL
jgi:hypothetical protein